MEKRMTDWLVGGMFDRTFWADGGGKSFCEKGAMTVLRPLAAAIQDRSIGRVPKARS
jgi:hypothetical protein